MLTHVFHAFKMRSYTKGGTEMKKSLSALLAGIMALSLAACSGGSTAPEGGGSSDTPATAEASDDKSSMIVAIASQFDTLDPCVSTTVYNGYVISHIYSGLMRTNTEGQPEPDLCTGFDISDDGLTYTFHLRDDVTFSDGTPITSANYEYAWLRAMSYGIDATTRTNDMVTYIKGGRDYNTRALEAGDSFDCTTEDHSSVGINCIDDYTIEVTLENPLAYFPQWLGAGVWSALPLDTPQHDNAWSLEPGYATSGPYVLDYININDKAEISRNEKYFKPDFVKMDKITFQVMPDPDAQAMGYDAGEIDVALNISTETSSKYMGTDSLWVLNYPSAYGLVVNAGPPGPDFLKDVRVRKALYIAIDKDAIIDVIGGPDMHPALGGWVAYGLGGVDGDFRTERDAKGYEAHYDPEEAKRLLAEAGYDGSDDAHTIHLTYKYSTNSYHADVATMLQQMWTAVGLDVDFDAVESGVYYSQLDNGDIQIGRYGLQISDSPISFLDWLSGDFQQTSLAGDETFDQMLRDVKKISDEKEFLTRVHEIEDYFCQEQFLVFPMWQNAQPALVKTNLKGYELHITTLWFGNCYFE